jgi:hypothetical protein
LKLEGVLLELSPKVIDKSGQEAGIRTETGPIFGEYEHFEVSKEPQVCQFFNTQLGEDICREIEGYLFKLILSPSDGAAFSEIPSLDYCAPSSEKGITILLGGDHGDRYFRFHAKIHLTSPMERIKCRDLFYECPIVQIACCECTKDKYIILKETVKPRLDVSINLPCTLQRRSYGIMRKAAPRKPTTGVKKIKGLSVIEDRAYAQATYTAMYLFTLDCVKRSKSTYHDRWPMNDQVREWWKARMACAWNKYSAKVQREV